MAEECLREAFALQEDHIPSLLALSCLLLHNGLVTDSAFLEDAEVYIHAAKDLSPDNATVWAMLSVIMEGTEDPNSSRYTYQQIVQPDGLSTSDCFLFTIRRFSFSSAKSVALYNQLHHYPLPMPTRYKNILDPSGTERAYGQDEIVHVHHEVTRLVEAAVESGEHPAQANGYLGAAKLMLTMGFTACADSILKHVSSEYIMQPLLVEELASRTTTRRNPLCLKTTYISSLGFLFMSYYLEADNIDQCTMRQYVVC